MAKDSKISWTHATYNPWIGCTKVSPGCANCYAAELDKRKKFTAEGWGKGKPRHRTKTAGDVRKWNREAEGKPERPRVFCASLADWLDDEVPVEWLADLLALIFETPNLDWLLLTKRPENWGMRMAAAHKYLEQVVTVSASKAFVDLDYWLHGAPPPNVWIGTTVENQQYAEHRIPELLKIPAKVRFLSVEPMLGPVDMMKVLVNHKLAWFANNHRGGLMAAAMSAAIDSMPWVDWVICGGESGPGRRSFEVAWAEYLAEQCATLSLPFFMKQDAHAKSGQRGNLSEELWSLKQFPAQGGAQ